MILPYLNHRISRSFLFILLLSGGWLWSQPCVNTFPYVADFETSNGGWSGITLGTQPSSWVWTTNIANPIINSAASGTGCWVTGNNPTLAFPLEPYSYFAGEQSAAVSPCFDFSGLQNPGIQFNIWWESERGDDGTRFQYSTNNGVTWTTLGDYLDPFNWYQDSSVSALGFGPGWSGDTLSGNSGSNGWVPAQRSLAFLAGQASVRFRFLFASDINADTASIMDGFAFDDVVIAERPNANLGPDTTLCFTQAVSLSMCDPGGASYFWSTNPLDTSCVLVASQSNTYIGFLVDTLGFVVTDTIEITVSPTFVNLGPNQTICPGDTVLLDATNADASYLWMPDSQTTSTIEVFETGEYFVSVSDSFGCVTEDSINILVEPVPPVDLGPDTTICAGSTISLDAGSGPPGTIYTWGPISASTQVVLIASPGLYTVSVSTPNGCSAADTVNIGVSLFPVVNLGDDRAVCDSVLLDAGNPGSTYQWSTSPLDTNQFLNATLPGVYYVDVVNQFGCGASDTVEIAITSAPIVNAGPDTFLCPNQSIVLDAGIAGQEAYFWSNGDTTQTTTISTPGTYTVRVTNIGNCVGRDTIEVAQSTLAVDLGPDQTICVGDTTLLDAGPLPISYLWSTGESTRTILATQGTSYTVTVTDSLGCQATDDIDITLQNPPQLTIDISGNDTLFGIVNFSGGSGSSPSNWSWSFGDGNTAAGQTASHTYVSADTFLVCLTASEGACVDSVCENLVISLPVNILEQAGASFSLYPNPARDWVQMTLTLPVSASVSAHLLDLTGRQVWQKDWGAIATIDERLDLASLPKGLYLLRLEVAGQSAVYRISKQ